MIEDSIIVIDSLLSEAIKFQEPIEDENMDSINTGSTAISKRVLLLQKYTQLFF